MRAQDKNLVAEELELARRACRYGDQEEGRRAAAELLGRYKGRVYCWCMRHMADHDQALDMAQNVLMQAFRKLDSYEGKSPFVCWLWAIARNQCLGELRRPRLLYVGEFDFDSLQAEGPLPDEALEQKLATAKILTVIETVLDAQEQQAIRLRCFERMPVEAITQALRLQDSSGARALLQRARRKLRAALAARDNQQDGNW